MGYLIYVGKWRQTDLLLLASAQPYLSPYTLCGAVFIVFPKLLLYFNFTQ